MNKSKKVRLAYLSGPVDAADVYARWKTGEHTQLFGTSYLMQFFELCQQIDAEAFVVTTQPGSFTRQQLGNVIIENRPLPELTGFRYHLAIAWWMLALAAPMIQFRPSAFVATANQNYWFLLSFLKLMGVEIIPSAHCVMWRPFRPIPLHWRPLLWLDGVFLRLFVRRAMAVSDVAGNQLKSLAGGDDLNVSIITPTYNEGHFDGISAADHTKRPFRVLFSGRVEVNKGVFDLIEIAERLQRDRPGEFHFDICGEGSALDRLRKEAEGLGNAVGVHGFCDKSKLAQLMSDCHVVVVPTRSDFEEGLPKSCAESVLAGRPFVASPVCPLLYTLGSAAIGVPPDDVMAYHDAIVSLADDRALYESKVRACRPLQAQFYDVRKSYQALLRAHLVNAQIILPKIDESDVSQEGAVER